MSDMRCLCGNCIKIKCEYEARRFEAAKAAMQGMLAAQPGWALHGTDPGDITSIPDSAVKYADALLERLGGVRDEKAKS